MSKQPTYRDLMECTDQHELRKTYKMDNDKRGNAEFEQAVRKHIDGASQKERRDFYQSIYGKRR